MKSLHPLEGSHFNTEIPMLEYFFSLFTGTQTPDMPRAG